MLSASCKLFVITERIRSPEVARTIVFYEYQRRSRAAMLSRCPTGPSSSTRVLTQDRNENEHIFWKRGKIPQTLINTASGHDQTHSIAPGQNEVRNARCSVRTCDFLRVKLLVWRGLYARTGANT